MPVAKVVHRRQFAGPPTAPAARCAHGRLPRRFCMDCVVRRRRLAAIGDRVIGRPQDVVDHSSSDAEIRSALAPEVPRGRW